MSCGFLCGWVQRVLEACLAALFVGIGERADEAGSLDVRTVESNEDIRGQGRNRGFGRVGEGAGWGLAACGLAHSQRGAAGSAGLLHPPTVTVRAAPKPSKPCWFWLLGSTNFTSLTRERDASAPPIHPSIHPSPLPPLAPHGLAMTPFMPPVRIRTSCRKGRHSEATLWPMTGDDVGRQPCS